MFSSEGRIVNAVKHSFEEYGDLAATNSLVEDALYSYNNNVSVKCPITVNPFTCLPKCLSGSYGYIVG
jgi:hypothetical protein